LEGLTAGLAKPSTLTWKGKSRNAPRDPGRGAQRRDGVSRLGRGRSGLTSTPETGKWTTGAA
jgi:hypothetical protein